MGKESDSRRQVANQRGARRVDFVPLRMVNDALEGTLSSYSHCLLLIHFLQSIALLPNLQDKEASGILDEERAKFGETELFDGVACRVSR